MKKRLFIRLGFCIPVLCCAQIPILRYYEYDEAGNRVLHKVIYMQPVPPAPPEDSLKMTSDGLQVTVDEFQEKLASFGSQKSPEYYIEKLARVEMKIYPNPATEKVTFSVSNMENLQTGTLQLYSLNGQLLQTHPVHSETTTISLVGLAKGTYILKVQINEKTENWKIIKQ